jgi:phage baseplate assembly protein W
VRRVNNNIRRAPYLGRGMAFPFRVDRSTGGTQATYGNTDSIAVGLEYLAERWTMREKPEITANHIAEAVHHILMTSPREHDTLPEFGSNLFHIIFEPNTLEFQYLANHYFSFATDRWEKRARIPEEGGMAWVFEGQKVDEGRLPVTCYVNFIRAQAEQNLVSPFVTPLQARLQEYPNTAFDDSGHDYHSRYYGASIVEIGGNRYNRFKRPRIFAPARDDEWYEVKTGDTWLLISWDLYGDIRYWPILKTMYIQDVAADEGTRDAIDPCPNPEPASVIRVPSKTRMMMEYSISEG